MKNENIEKLEDEEWKQHSLGIWVSSKGRVNTKRKGVHFGHTKVTGYKEVWWQGKLYLVHRLVAECFLDNPNNLPMVNHKDENKRNNCVNNLEWCDAKYNLNYGTCIERRVANTDYKARTVNTDYKARTANTDYKALQAKRVEKISIPIVQYTRLGEFVREWQSATIAARELGYYQNSITKCCKGKLKSANGFVWRYKEKKED